MKGKFLCRPLPCLMMMSALSLTGCLSAGPWPDSPASNAVFEAILGTPLELSIYAEMFRGMNGRWPTNYDELKLFAGRDPFLARTNGPLPLADCREADLTELTNGSLTIRYVFEYGSNQVRVIGTNEFTISPGTNNSTREFKK